MERAGRLFGRLKLPGDIVSTDDLARASWPAAVGKKIAAHSVAVGLVRSRLVVEVEDIVWQRQLNALRGQILRNIHRAVGAGIVDDIEFRPMGERRAPQRAETVRSLPAAGDEAGAIADPVLRRVYIASRKKATA